MKHILVACLLISTACKPLPVQKPFPQEYQLTSVRIPLGRTIQSTEMELINDFLVYHTYSFLFYSVSDQSFTYSLGSRSQPVFRTPQIIRSSLPYLYIMDVDNKNEIRKYMIDSIGYPVLLQTGFAGVNTAMNRPYILNDSLIVYDEFVPEASLKIYNMHTHKEERVLQYGATSLDDRFFDKKMGGLYANDSCMAFAYKYQDRIDFYDWQFNLIRSVNHQLSDPVIHKEKENYLKNIHYYGYSYMGRNYFYTLYRGISNSIFYSDSLAYYLDLLYDYGLTRDVLEVYDLNGEPVCRFRFNDVAPAVFVVDEEQNILMGHRVAYTDSLLLYHLQGLPKNRKKYTEKVHVALSFFPDIAPPEDPVEIIRFRSIGNMIGLMDKPRYWVYYEYSENRLFNTPEARGAFTASIAE